MSVYAIGPLMLESRWRVYRPWCERCSRAAPICSRRLTAGISWLRCNVAPAPRSHESAFPGCLRRLVCLHSHLRPLDVYLAAPPLRLSHLLASVYFTFQETLHILKALEFCSKTPRCCITSRNLAFDWHSEVLPNNELCWIKRPCERAYPSRLIAAIISLFPLHRSSQPAFCQDKQTSRQLSRSLGLQWRICQGSLPLQGRGLLFQLSDCLRKLEVVPLTNFL